MNNPDAAPIERKPYAPPVIQSRPGFDPANCSPEQWCAILWVLNQHVNHVQVMDEPVAEAVLARVQVNPAPVRISAEAPRTGDMIEDATGRRYWFVDSKPERVIKDSLVWNLLCRLPGIKTFLGGCPT